MTNAEQLLSDSLGTAHADDNRIIYDVVWVDPHNGQELAKYLV